MFDLLISENEVFSIFSLLLFIIRFPSVTVNTCFLSKILHNFYPVNIGAGAKTEVGAMAPLEAEAKK